MITWQIPSVPTLRDRMTQRNEKEGVMNEARRVVSKKQKERCKDRNIKEKLQQVRSNRYLSGCNT